MKTRTGSSLILRFGCVLWSFVFLAVATQAKDLAPYDFDHFFDASRLVKIDIQIDQADWDKLRMQHRSLLKTLRTDIPPSKQEKQFDYFPANLTIDGTDLGKVAVRKKGFVGSMDRERPSFKIQVDKFDKKKSFAGIDTITLNNNKQDPTRVHQVIGYQIFRDAGLPASECNFALVTLNGKSLGVYCNVESLDKRFARRKLGNADGTLYEGTLADFVEDSLIRFERKFGKKKRDKKLAAVAEALKADDDSLVDGLGEIVDLDNFYRYWALENLLGHWDGYVSNKNNYFVYYDPTTGRIQFIPWGIDQLGRDDNMFWGPGFEAPKSVKADGAMARRLYQIEDAQDVYFATLRNLLDTVWQEEELIAQIERLEELIKPHRVSFGRSQRPGIDLKEFISGRRAEMEAEMSGDYPEWTLAPRPGLARVEKVGECEFRFSFRMPDFGDNLGSFVATTGEVGDMKIAIDGAALELESAEFALRQNNDRWRGNSFTLQISIPDAREGQPSTIEVIEVTFPERVHADGDPFRIDVFASPATGRLLNRSGNVDQEGTVAAPAGIRLAGTLELVQFGSGAGDRIEGILRGEFYAFLPKDTDRE